MFNLFNSVGNNQNNFFSSMNFADYASIRNGSYNKLVKAYYAKTDSGSSSNSASTGTNRTSDKKYWDYNEKIKNPPKKEYHYWNYNEKIKGEKAPGEKFVDIKNAASNVKSATSSMEKSGEISYDAVSSYVSRYNDLVNATKNSGSVVINSSMRSISDYTKSNADALAEIGITIDDKGTLKINKETFQAASSDSVDALFKGTNSYGTKVGSRAAAIQSNAKYEASKYGITDTSSTSGTTSSSSSSSSSSVTEKPAATSGQLSVVRSNASSLAETAGKLSSGTNSIFKTDDEGNYDTDAIYNAVSDFVKQYNATVESAGKSNVAAIKYAALASMTDSTKANSSKLAEIGIKIDSSKKTLTLDKEQLKAAGPEKVKDLFAGGYGNKINDRASAISYHANYEINKGGMYSSTGSYNYNSKSAFDAAW